MSGMFRGALVELPDGNTVIFTNSEGVNAFLRSELSQTYLSSDIEEIKRIGQEEGISQEDEMYRFNLQFKMNSIPEKADIPTFRSSVPRSEIQVWLKYVIVELKRLSTNEGWIRTGELEPSDRTTLLIVASMFRHPVPVSLAFGSDFFQVMTAFLKARSGNIRGLPSAEIALTITRITSFAYSMTRLQFDNKWTADKTFKKLEASGALYEFIRCASIPQEHGERDDVLNMCFGELLTSGRFLQRKFIRGQPCGDLVAAILQGKDGSSMKRPWLMSRLETISKYAQESDIFQTPGVVVDACIYCGNTKNAQGKRLMQCGRCKITHYCSRECQKADWKQHKLHCQPKSDAFEKKSEAASNASSAFIDNSYLEIMIKMSEQYHLTGLENKDMVIELNFMPDNDGIIPALQEPPKFTVIPVPEYLNGSFRPAWCQNGEDFSYLPELVGRMHSAADENSFIFVVFHDREMHGFKKKIGTMTSPVALKAFHSAIAKGDYGPLSGCFDNEKLWGIRQNIEGNRPFLQARLNFIEAQGRVPD